MFLTVILQRDSLLEELAKAYVAEQREAIKEKVKDKESQPGEEANNRGKETAREKRPRWLAKVKIKRNPFIEKLMKMSTPQLSTKKNKRKYTKRKSTLNSQKNSIHEQSKHEPHTAKNDTMRPINTSELIGIQPEFT